MEADVVSAVSRIGQHYSAYALVRVETDKCAKAGGASIVPNDLLVSDVPHVPVQADVHLSTQALPHLVAITHGALEL